MSTKIEITGDGAVQTESYTRKPFPVDAVQVSEDNIQAVATWCGGEIRYSTKTVMDADLPYEEAKKTETKVKIPYVKVGVHHPLNERQTKAYAGDWVLKSDSGFKVYTERAFEKSFELKMHVETKTDFRDARTGRFVTKEYAEQHPDTTVSETDYQEAEGLR